ncbi:MAG TPA: TonB family protein [Pyrinomonadaceae bacterium]|nr:TonB family protein [Pyrinomonadaceae bacterium]
MLDQLVESKEHSAENTRKSELVIGIAVLAVLIMIGLWTRDLFAHGFDMGGGDLELSTLVAPPPPADEPPPPKPEKQPEQKQPDVDVRKELIQNIMQTPVKPPDTISTVKNAIKEMRLNVNTKLGGSDSDTGATLQGAGRVVDSGGTNGLAGTGGTGDAGTGGEEEAPPPKATPKPIPKTISGGVLNGKATSLPKPAYPPAARAVHASGACNVQVTISETGGVISASAVSCHPLLKAAAESAARGAHFSPTLLSGQPVKVTGVITYNFVP